MTFTGFETADFDAFAPKKRKSNAYTLERRRVRDKLLALANALTPRLETAVDDLELATTEDAPAVSNGRSVDSMAAYWVRPAPVRAALAPRQSTDLQAQTIFQIAVHQQHPHVRMGVTDRGFELGFRLPRAAKHDRTNASRKLRLDWAHEEWAEGTAGLGSEARFGSSGDLRRIGDWTAEGFSKLADDLDNGGELEGIQIFERNDSTVATAELVDRIVPPVKAWLRTLRFFAWSPTNDHSPVQAAVDEAVAEDEKKETHSELGPGDRVTILSGLFAGRAGYLSEVDAKGRAKVMVGPVSVSVAVDELKGAS
ncbi:MAG TPA: hypothetical protein RMG48_06255 [Myxococcales bacterium LLY-WYZ-16_1]|nr:hypothetical protein [Myxococcales bacterium LLY-WYZ-16_1]